MPATTPPPPSPSGSISTSDGQTDNKPAPAQTPLQTLYHSDTINHLKDWSKPCRIQKINQERRRKNMHEDKEERRERRRHHKHTQKTHAHNCFACVTSRTECIWVKYSIHVCRRHLVFSSLWYLQRMNCFLTQWLRHLALLKNYKEQCLSLIHIWRCRRIT